MSARLARAALWLTGVLVAAWLVAPTLVVIPLGFTDKVSLTFPPTGWSTRWYANFFSDPAWTAALANSLLVGVLVAVVATVLGTAAAFGLSRWTSRRGAAAARVLLLAPMIVPGIIVAIGVYAVFLKFQLAGSLAGFVAAHTVLALPFVVVSVSASLGTFDVRLEAAAASLGAGRWATFRQVTLPLIMPGVVSGALFAFVTSFDEVVVSLFIQSPALVTLPVQMYSSVTRETDPTLAAAATMILALTTVLVTGGLALSARRNRAR
ncbi:ABC transporter permease [Microtetraspora malaysiensis]|uniref:ABC transporter permease n=1 Tax=Microtetraspora malaysiensis TaxID=161358 RepID=A0ABW6SL11_9ACTN